MVHQPPARRHRGDGHGRSLGFRREPGGGNGLRPRRRDDEAAMAAGLWRHHPPHGPMGSRSPAQPPGTPPSAGRERGGGTDRPASTASELRRVRPVEHPGNRRGRRPVTAGTCPRGTPPLQRPVLHPLLVNGVRGSRAWHLAGCGRRRGTPHGRQAAPRRGGRGEGGQRRGAGCRRCRRDVAPHTQRHVGILGRPCGNGHHPRRRMAPDRRPGHGGPDRLPPSGRPGLGDVHPGRLQRVPAGGRGRPGNPPGHRPGGRGPAPDDVLGEVGVAVVVPTNPDEAPTLDQIIAHGRADLSSYKLPAAVRIVDRLPLNSGDKLDRRALAAGEAGQQADG